jgi:hypothetical protein
MRVAVLYICTGAYGQFFSGFYESARKYFLCDIAEVRYFVFTDNMKLTDAEDVELIHHKCNGFPMDSLMRFDMFLSVAEKLKDFDYTFFFNANMLFVSPVGEDILPDSLTAVIHPGLYNKPVWRYPYERDKRSTAYIPPHDKDYCYYMGSVNGGRTADYLELASVCSKNIHKDLEQGLIAVYHDESHLNHYLHYHPCTALSPSYAYIEGRKMPFPQKIIIRDKVKVDPCFDKEPDHSLWALFKKGVRILWRGINWYV